RPLEERINSRGNRVGKPRPESRSFLEVTDQRGEDLRPSRTQGLLKGVHECGKGTNLSGRLESLPPKFRVSVCVLPQSAVENLNGRPLLLKTVSPSLGRRDERSVGCDIALALTSQSSGSHSRFKQRLLELYGTHVGVLDLHPVLEHDVAGLHRLAERVHGPVGLLSAGASKRRSVSNTLDRDNSLRKRHSGVDELGD